jgi:hypothetical protein
MPLPGFATLDAGYCWGDGGGASVAWASSYRTLPQTESVTRLFARQRRNPTFRATASLLKSTTGSARRRSPAGTPMVSAMSWLCHQLPEKNFSRPAISKKLLQFQLLQLELVCGCMRVPRELGLSFHGRNRTFSFATAGCCDCLQSWRDCVRSRNGKNGPSQGRRVGGVANDDLQLVSAVAVG